MGGQQLRVILGVGFELDSRIRGVKVEERGTMFKGLNAAYDSVLFVGSWWVFQVPGELFNIVYFLEGGVEGFLDFLEPG